MSHSYKPWNVYSKLVTDEKQTFDQVSRRRDMRRRPFLPHFTKKHVVLTAKNDMHKDLVRTFKFLTWSTVLNVKKVFLEII